MPKKKSKKKVVKKKVQEQSVFRIPKSRKRNHKKTTFVMLGIILVLAVIVVLMNLFIDFDKYKTPECVRVQTKCCPCSAGGEEVCVLESEKENYIVNNSECGNQFCVQMYNCNPAECEFEGGVCGFDEE